MNIWEHFGFTSNPYETSPIRGNEEGERLLVGRTSELNHLETALASSSAHPTIEGENGAGKTSVISVAGFRRQEAFKAGKTKQLIIPMRRAFQLHSAITTERFERDVLLEVAQAIAENYEILSSLDRGLPLIDDVKRWISSPIINTGGGGGASFAGFGASATSSNTPNTTTGFAESGFSTIVRKWLADLFPDRTSGGFLCVVDNLELLETSRMLEIFLSRFAIRSSTSKDSYGYSVGHAALSVALPLRRDCKVLSRTRSTLSLSLTRMSPM